MVTGVFYGNRYNIIPTSFKLRIKPFKFDAGTGGSKTPIDFTGFLVAPLIPCRRLFPHPLYRGYAPRQPVVVYHIQFYLRHVKPASML
jgi:hypothetical protein